MKFLRVLSLVALLTLMGWDIVPVKDTLAQSAPSAQAHEVAAALDANANGVLDDSEILEAIRLWITGSTVPGSALTIDDALVLELVRMWIAGTPIDGSADSFKTLDEQFADVARQVPGFGGMFLGANNVLNVYVSDPSAVSQDAIADAIVAVFGADRIPSNGIQVLQGDFGFLNLKQWHDQHSESTLTIDGVVFVDISESRNRLRVAVVDIGLQSQVLAALTKLGVPEAAVEIFESAPMETSSGHGLRDRQRPLVGDIQISPNGGLCTLGFLAVLNGVAGFVTNSHCTAVRGMVDGSVYFQHDALNQGNFIGTEAVDPPQYTGNGCPSGRQCRLSDSAFVQLAPGGDPGVSLEAAFGSVALPSNENGGMRFDGTIRILSEATSLLEGEVVHKVGRTTGHTTGEIIDTCVSSNSFRNGVDTGITMICQYRVDSVAGPGDSGSPVFAVRPSANVAVGAFAELYGILWGGNNDSFIFSPISSIEFELGSVRTHKLESAPNSPPVVQIVAPANGAGVGFGSLNLTDFEVTVVDFEDGAQCCSVKWTSDVDGDMGGGKTLQYAFSSPGQRTITATVTDQDGASASHSIVVVAGENQKPQVTIDRPLNFESFQLGTPVVFEGTSYDPNEPFQTLDCQKLTWTSDVPGDPFPLNGCNLTVTLTTPGPRTITLTGVDSQGLSDTDKIDIFIIVPGPDAPPEVTIINPNDNTLLPAHQAVQLTASADDPDDKSPISYKWFVEVFGAKKEIASGTMTDGQQITVPWTPSSDVPGNCGTQPAVLSFQATDADGKSGEKAVNIQVLFGAC